MSNKPSIVSSSIHKIKENLMKNDKVPFLRTCPQCNQPLRSNDMTISVGVSAVNPMNITDIRYYCEDHCPKPEEITDDLLISYSFVADIKIIEPSPDCNKSDRTIKIKNSDYSQPNKV